jgi:ribonucleoside-triphosphate reductase
VALDRQEPIDMMDTFQEFIALSRYARWIPEKNRRETWSETVDRYWSWVTNKFPILKDHDYIWDSIYTLEVMPSMRLLMTAGPSVDRDNTCAYNCSYLPIKDIRSFAEVMFILMNGTGVGYSVEARYTQCLPAFPKITRHTDRKIVVEDSKEGWADALYMLLRSLYSGVHPTWDLSGVRPAGSRLHTFGGRASGPGPLEEVFKFAVSLAYKAQGRKLTTLECHDLCCVIARSVIVGGVRRSAMISLSDLHDSAMAKCKSGAWWEGEGYRALANNSAVYEGKPSIDSFMTEWHNLYDSHSGERGIFNRFTVDDRDNLGRNLNHNFGTNPCGEILLREYGFCNLSEVVIRQEDTFDTLKKKVEIATILGTIQSTLTSFPFLRPEWTINAREERLLGVSFTGIYDNAIMSQEGEVLQHMLESLREHAVAVNKEWAAKLGINTSKAITCVKPSGTVSCLVNSSSGIHPRFSQYYYRRARIDKKDPMYPFLRDQGVPVEDCVMNPDSTAVFTFAVKSPEAVKELQPLEHLRLWQTYKTYWTHHNPSVTINYTDDTFLELGSEVYKNFNKIGGISFLPKVDHIYAQAPFEEIDEETYNNFPKIQVDWSKLSEYELEDTTKSSHTFACTGNSCEMVDITNE